MADISLSTSFEKYVVGVLFFLLSNTLLAQSFSIQGHVVDQHAHPVEGVVVSVSNYKEVTTTNIQGDFILKNVEAGSQLLKIEYFGISTLIFEINLQSDTVLEQSIILHSIIHQLDEVVVSRKLKSQSVDAMVSQFVNSDFIRKNTGGSLMQSLEKLPGVKSIHIGSSNSKPLIRGLGFNQVAVVENGLKHEGQQWGADHGLEIDQHQVGSVEIIKGPASIIYGTDAIGGVVKIDSRSEPDRYTFGGSIDLIGKSNNMLFGSSAHFFARKDKWYVEGRLTYQDYADYRVPADSVFSYNYAVNLHKRRVRNTAGSEFNQFLRIGRIGEKASTAFYLSHHSNESGLFANAHGLEPRNVDENLHDQSRRDIQLPSQKVHHAKFLHRTQLYFSDHQLMIDWGCQKNYRKEFSQYTNHGYMPTQYPEHLKMPKELERLYDKDVWSLNVMDKIPLGRNSLSVGLNSEYQKNKIGGWGFLIPAFQSFNLGLFAHDKFYISDRWMLEAALRYDLNGMHVQAYQDWFPSDMIQDGVREQQYLQRASKMNKRYSSYTWSTGFTFKPDDWKLSLNLGKGFRTPIAKELASNGVNYHYFRYEKGNENLKPEESYQLDIGVQWSHEKVQVELTPFASYFTNYIFLNPTSNYDTYYGAGNQVFEYNQAQVMRAGVELQAVFEFWKQMYFETGFEYLYNQQLSGSKKGYTLPYSPPTSMLFSISYEPVDLGKRIKQTHFKIESLVYLAQNNIVPPEKKTPAYHVWNFSMGGDIHIGKVPIQLVFNIDNLLNQKYLSHTSFYRLIELPEMGRSFNLSVKVPFQWNMKRR